MALAHHLSALDTPKESDIAFRRGLAKALQLYQVAYELQVEVTQRQSSNISPRFIMIMANNLSQIHDSVNNQAKSNMCLDLLLSTMVLWLDSPEALQLSDGDEKETIDGFFRNATRIILEKKCASAA